MPSNDILQEVNQALAETTDSNTPIKRFSKYEIKTVINSLKSRKSPGYDLITATLLKNLPKKVIMFHSTEMEIVAELKMIFKFKPLMMSRPIARSVYFLFRPK